MQNEVDTKVNLSDSRVQFEDNNCFLTEWPNITFEDLEKVEIDNKGIKFFYYFLLFILLPHKILRAFYSILKAKNEQQIL